MYVLVRAGLYPGLSVYCLLLTASPVLQSICSGVREILFCTSVLVEHRVCVHPLFVLYCIVYYKSVCVSECLFFFQQFLRSFSNRFSLFCSRLVVLIRVCVCVCVFRRGWMLDTYISCLHWDLSVLACETCCCVIGPLVQWPVSRRNQQ